MNAVEQVTAAVASALAAHVGAHEHVCVALSGGMDSVVLLDAVANIRNDVSAVHVHHGLSPNADEWAKFCQHLCETRGIPLAVHRVSVDVKGQGIEAAARAARYAVYSTVDARWILQGHHADDAAETLLLRLNRGTGLRGLAGIPMSRALGPTRRLLRPFLRLPRAVLREYSQARKLEWIEDESNHDTRLDRNFLRNTVVPALSARFPHWRENWLRAADHVREAYGLLEDLAKLDAGEAPQQLSLVRLRALSSERLRNVLRYFLAVHGAELPDTGHLADIERRIRGCGSESVLGIRVGERALMHYRGELFCTPARCLSEPADVLRPFHAGETLSIPELQGTLHFDPVMGSGIVRSSTGMEPMVVRGQGQPAAMRLSHKRPTRTLKNLFQEAGVPPWERAWLPRIFLGNDLVWVAGIGIAAHYQAAPGEPGLQPRWEPWSSGPAPDWR
ncbi:MAG: tRNA lysidine(34) synthetase TilS [Burkholderiales bacterium]|nr:tRNA lysidine(34) synthetase TilS [Burkholderiales bacterium]